jgi:uncharacterized FlaG/YvyC family protein
MKKEIILTIFISIGAYELYKLYMWIIQERKKHRKKKLPNEVDGDSEVVDNENNQDPCILRSSGGQCIYPPDSRPKKSYLNSNLNSNSTKKNKCINYPIDTSPNSPYVGVKDEFTFEIIYNVAIILAVLGLIYMYFN